MKRVDGRGVEALRPVTIEPGFVKTAAGSCLISFGDTRVLCTASVEESVPPFLKGRHMGWLTAEYAMLPASTGSRKQRDGVKRDGRGVEIGRLIGRSLRQALDLTRLGERSITIDCDVIQADGGTRTAAITGGFVALCLAIEGLIKQGKLKESPIIHQVAAISCGVIADIPMLDLCYREDSMADTDMNVVMNERFRFIELQGTGEGRAFSADELGQMLSLAHGGMLQLFQKQAEALGQAAYVIGQPQTLVLASNNEHKLRELKAVLGSRYRLLSMKEAGLDIDIDENGSSFQENAIIKAEAVRDATGYHALADDSGLIVQALDGAPGVRSARYAGVHGDDQANNELLIKNLKDVPAPRKAVFVSAIALASPFTLTRVFEGVCPGDITFAPRGSGGFGYDPYFEYENGQTFAEMSDEQKAQVSHRARAMHKLLEALQ